MNHIIDLPRICSAQIAVCIVLTSIHNDLNGGERHKCVE